jgi:DME family drug/metabolite transporter
MPSPARSSTAVLARKKSVTPLLCLSLAGILWGAGGLVGVLLGRVSGATPLSVAAFRLLAGGGLLVAFHIAARQRWPRGRAAWTRIAVTGLLSAGFQAAYFCSIALSSVSLATLITIGGVPVIVSGAGMALGRERPTRASLVTLALALTGLGLLVGIPGGGYSGTAMLASAGLALASAAGFAAMTLVGASAVPGLDDVALTGIGSALGGLALLPLAAAVGGIAFRPTAEAIWLVAALGIGPTALAYTLYYRGLRSASPTTAALLTLLEPLTATLLGAAVLGDRLSAPGIAGSILLGISVLGAIRLTMLRPPADDVIELSEDPAGGIGPPPGG